MLQFKEQVRYVLIQFTRCNVWLYDREAYFVLLGYARYVYYVL
jgi:hypothetical protein